MSSLNFIAIKGNHINNLSEIFAAFGYIDLNRDKQFDSWDKSATFLYENYFEFSEKDIAIRGIWINKDWTIICDPEMVDSTDNIALEKLSQNLNSEVLTFLIQSTSGSYGFEKFSPSRQRQFFSTAGQVAENLGTPMKEEFGLNINEKVFVDDIMQLAGRIGIDLEVKNVNLIVIKELGYNDEMKRELEQFKQPERQKFTASNKPWWKLW